MHLTRAVSPDRWDASRAPGVAPGDVVLPPIAASLTICPPSSWRLILDGPPWIGEVSYAAAATSRRSDGKCVGETETSVSMRDKRCGCTLPGLPPCPCGYGFPKVSRNPVPSNRLFAPRGPNNARRNSCSEPISYYAAAAVKRASLERSLFVMSRSLRSGVIIGLVLASLPLAPGLGQSQDALGLRGLEWREDSGRPMARWRALQRPGGAARARGGAIWALPHDEPAAGRGDRQQYRKPDVEHLPEYREPRAGSFRSKRSWESWTFWSRNARQTPHPIRGAPLDRDDRVQ